MSREVSQTDPDVDMDKIRTRKQTYGAKCIKHEDTEMEKQKL